MKKLLLSLLFFFWAQTALAAANETIYIDNAKLTSFGGNSTIEYRIAGPLKAQTEYILRVTPQESVASTQLQGKTMTFSLATLSNNILKLELPGLNLQEASRYYLGKMEITPKEPLLNPLSVSTPAGPPALNEVTSAPSLKAQEIELNLNCFVQQGKITVTAFAFASEAAKKPRGSFFVLGYREKSPADYQSYLYGTNSDKIPADTTIVGTMTTEKGQSPANGERYCFKGYFSANGENPIELLPKKPVCCTAPTAEMSGKKLEPYKKGEAKRRVETSKDKKTACGQNGLCTQVTEEWGTGLEIFAAAYEENEPNQICMECSEDAIGWQGPNYKKDEKLYSSCHAYGADKRDRLNSAYFTLKGLRSGMQYRCHTVFYYGTVFPRKDYGPNVYARTKKISAFIEDFCNQTAGQISVLISTFGYNVNDNKNKVTVSALYREIGTTNWLESEQITLPDPKSKIPRNLAEGQKLINERTVAPHNEGGNWCYPIGEGQYQITIKNLAAGTTYEFRPKVTVENGHPDTNLQYEPKKIYPDRYQDDFETKNFRTAGTFNTVVFPDIKYSEEYNNQPIAFNAKFKNAKKDFWGWFVIGALQSADKWCTPQQRIRGGFDFNYKLPIGLTKLKACDNSKPLSKDKQFYRMANTDYNVMAFANYQGADGKWRLYQSDALLFRQNIADKSKIIDISAQLTGEKPTLIKISAKIQSKDPNVSCFFQIKENTGANYNKIYSSPEVKPVNGICTFTLSEYGTPLFWTSDTWWDGWKKVLRSKERNISIQHHLLPLTKYILGMRLRDYTGIVSTVEKGAPSNILDKEVNTPQFSSYIENVPVHVQWAEPWGSYVLESGHSMANYGCGDASLSMVIAHWYRQSKGQAAGFAAKWDKYIYPEVCAKLRGAWKGYCKDLGSEPNPLSVQRWEELQGMTQGGAWQAKTIKEKLRLVGLDIEPVCTHNMAQIRKNYLNKNIPLVVKTRPSINSCRSQHYVVLLGFYDNRQFYLNGQEALNYLIINDPAMDHEEDKPRWINVQTLVSRTGGIYCGPHAVGNHATAEDIYTIDAMENGAFAVFPRNLNEEKNPNYLQTVAARTGCSQKFLNRFFYGK